jgi:hypothetical protein
MEDEYGLENEYDKTSRAKKNYVIFTKRPTNTLDFMNMNSDEYKNWKIKERIKQLLSPFNITEKYINEISDSCILYKNKSKYKLRSILPVVAYKVIKNNNLQISHSDLFKKLNFKKSKYLSLSNCINIDNPNPIGIEKVDINNENCLSQIDQCLFNAIPQLISMYERSPSIIKYSNKDILLDNITNAISFGVSGDFKIDNSNKFVSNDYFNVSQVLINARKNILKILDEEFFAFVNNRVGIEALSAALIKYYLKTTGLGINLKPLSDVVKLSTATISKAYKIIVECMKNKIKNVNM